ncbi:hypothetical protein HRR83_001344 [Exophiala dermatitidis]|uniref:Septin-type G domain-containing protein n=2 Tax=Exophiala dermatitidis TaxID=5970 RepID=H6C6N6_EXODN|nr:uncharacterized protein HMPREF1120_07372 [Exophiala dermatitidis NIH/UT8656]KAJ4522844.1 hypothetical protein HRR75_001238 [Exophiala dermatitidis]EHY59382.1 hypothetical protein HMPREF1120_07372 [Exophiala dermatitidis NIH/UT8656]KAJ4526155.1 hypothetical protein HRR74_001348 [Exophiala dermatitidis]KAJ4526900.1 hypothetical protein HRR73_001697 [Exophiala dermatitidis]KAJ4532612.1 hypothetical protein HRR76_007599 [Exophiala dermatitidis]
MRPGIGLDNTEPRPRKYSAVDSPSLPSDRYSASPTTFFLARDPDSPRTANDRSAGVASQIPVVSSLHDTIQEAERSIKHTDPRPAEARSVSRRRSTIKPDGQGHFRRRSSNVSAEAVQAPPNRETTPSPLPSRDISLPSSPKSVSSRSLQKSDDELTNDETGSQVVVSSEEDEGETPGVVQDSQPELIMPSITMPSRRPFTERGKRLGRFKIMVAGRKAVGKTSLIKSVVQLCEDIVHVDPSLSNSMKATQREGNGSDEWASEVYASTKPYPAWWPNVEESRILRRRKSMGDSVLERNICFVDAPDATKLDRIIHYVEQQLVNAMVSIDRLTNEFSGLLSGRGSSHVDVILYLISKDHTRDDCERIRQLSELCNVVPLVAKSDLLSQTEQDEIKQSLDTTLAALPRLPVSLCSETEVKATATVPYTVTSANGPDLDTMDASLLMSPEYIQPLVPSELSLLVEQLFEPETVAYLRHTSARKLVAWHARHPRLTTVPSPSLPSIHHSTLASPVQSSLSNSAALLPVGSDISLNTSNSWALAKVADHTQREERLAQVRLSKWASELQLSLQRERERYEKIARGERAVWLVERMGEEVRDGRILYPGDYLNPTKHQQALLLQKGRKNGMGYDDYEDHHDVKAGYQMHDPLGLLRWQDSMRTRGWIALQVVGSFGVVGGLAFWLARTWGLTASINDWVQGLHMSAFGQE